MGLFDSINRKFGWDIIRSNGVNEVYVKLNNSIILWSKYYNKYGMLHGKSLKYIAKEENNWVTSEINYKNGVKEGPLTYYWESKLSVEAMY